MTACKYASTIATAWVVALGACAEPHGFSESEFIATTSDELLTIDNLSTPIAHGTFELVPGQPGLTLRVAPGSPCLDVWMNGTGNGTPVSVNQCHGGANQQWTWIPASGALKNPQSGRCLDVTGGGASPDGTPLQIHDCHGGSNQRWTLAANGTLVSAATGKCVDVFSLANGMRAEVRQCNGGLNQFWVPAFTPLRGDASQKCLDVVNGSTAAGAPIQIWDCHSGANQSWRFGQNDTIIGAGSGRCLAASGTTNGSVTTIETCQPTEARQRWGRTGDGKLLNMASGRCLDVTAASTSAGARVQVWDCQSQWNNAHQLWGTLIDPEVVVGDVVANYGHYYQVGSGGRLNNLGSNGWDICPSGYSLVGHQFESNGFWLCARSDLVNRTFYVGDVEMNAGNYYRVSSSGVTTLPSQSWNACTDGSMLLGRWFDSNGFWVCMK